MVDKPLITCPCGTFICLTKQFISIIRWGQNSRTNCSKVTVIKPCYSAPLQCTLIAAFVWSLCTFLSSLHFLHHCLPLYSAYYLLFNSAPFSYPLKSWSSMLSPRILRNSLKAGVSSLFPNSSSSDVWEEETTKWQSTANRKTRDEGVGKMW